MATSSLMGAGQDTNSGENATPNLASGFLARAGIARAGDSERVVPAREAAKIIADVLRNQLTGNNGAGQAAKLVAIGILRGIELGIVPFGCARLSHSLENLYIAVVAQRHDRSDQARVATIGGLLFQVNASGLAIEGAKLESLSIPESMLDQRRSSQATEQTAAIGS